MREVLKNKISFLFLLISLCLLLSACDNFSFGGDLRGQVEDDLGVNYSYYEYPDEDGEIVKQKYITGRKVDKKAFPSYEHEGMIIAGWRYLKNFYNPEVKVPENFYLDRKKYIASIKITNSSEDLYAVWKPRCTVTFVTNCDIIIEPMAAAVGDALDWPEIERKHNGLLLWNWYTDPDFQHPFGYDEPVPGDMTLYAEWVEYRTITYYKNDGSSEKCEIDYRYDWQSSINDYTFRPRNGYGFMGWATSPNGDVVYHNGDPIRVTENMNLYAVWSQDLVTITYIDVSGNFEACSSQYGRGAYISVGRVLDTKENWFRYLSDMWRIEGKVIGGYSTRPDATPPYEFDRWGNYRNGSGGWSNAYQVNSDITLYVYIVDEAIANSTTGTVSGTVTFTETPGSDMRVIPSNSAGVWTFTAILPDDVDDSLFTYQWYFRNVLDPQIGNVATFYTGSLPSGVYDVSLIATDGTHIYSWSGQATKS